MLHSIMHRCKQCSLEASDGCPCSQLQPLGRAQALVRRSPPRRAPAFEDAFKSALPDKFEHHPDLLFHLTAMLSPRTLLDHNVPVFAVLQARPPSPAD